MIIGFTKEAYQHLQSDFYFFENLRAKALKNNFPQCFEQILDKDLPAIISIENIQEVEKHFHCECNPTRIYTLTEMN
jgi:hypothetical protein